MRSAGHKPADDVSAQVRAFKRAVWRHYRTYARSDLPWRHTSDPYHVLVSEIMLQQTQVERVVPKYTVFLTAFPTVGALASAELREVLLIWQGLGYNRRAKALHDTARVINARGGAVPTTYDDLVRLPGIGPYTAAAVCVFAYNMSVPMLETNIRTVLFYHFFPLRDRVSDTELMAVASLALERRRPREWHWALMDYGAWLKQRGVRLNAKSAHYTKQSRFEGSDRQVRGAILRVLTEHPSLSERELCNTVQAAPERIRTQLARLRKESML